VMVRSTSSITRPGIAKRWVYGPVAEVGTIPRVNGGPGQANTETSRRDGNQTSTSSGHTRFASMSPEHRNLRRPRQLVGTSNSASFLV
jgi:hypothetical protein